jgi:hypothetical protein
VFFKFIWGRSFINNRKNKGPRNRSLGYTVFYHFPIRITTFRWCGEPYFASAAISISEILAQIPRQGKHSHYGSCSLLGLIYHTVP